LDWKKGALGGSRRMSYLCGMDVVGVSLINVVLLCTSAPLIFWLGPVMLTIKLLYYVPISQRDLANFISYHWLSDVTG
jgi:hypothetical protein